MQVEIARHALDRVPISLIIDDSAPLVNLNYFFIRDRNRDTGETRRWEDLPVVIPESFTREFGEWCAEQGVKGKFSVVPCPAGLGRIDQGLPLFGRRQIESWLAMCREVIVPQFDITPEMLTHTYVLDLETLQPVEPRIWEQYEWATLPEDQEERIVDYIALACQILVNVGLIPQGVTSPGGFGGRNLPFYARVAGEALRRVTGQATPYFFQRVVKEPPVASPVWYADREAGTAVGEVIACTDDWTGSWTGYGEVHVDRYITSDLQGGRLPWVIDAGGPCILCSHWQGFYGLHNDDRRGFHALKTVVRRLRERDPYGEHTCWRKPSEIATYACAREMASLSVEPPAADRGPVIRLDLPVRVPELTLRVKGLRVRGVRCDGQSLQAASGRRSFRSGTFFQEGDTLLLAYDPPGRASTVELLL